MLAIRGTPRKPTPSSNEGVIRAPVAGEDAEPNDLRDMRQEVIGRRLAAKRNAKSGAGIPRPEASDKSEFVESRRFRTPRPCYSSTASLKIVKDATSVC